MASPASLSPAVASSQALTRKVSAMAAVSLSGPMGNSASVSIVETSSSRVRQLCPFHLASGFTSLFV